MPLSVLPSVRNRVLSQRFLLFPRLLHGIILYTISLAILLTILPASRSASRRRQAAKPDLDVTYIERTPLYPAFTVGYDMPDFTDLPVLLNPRTHEPFTLAEAQAVKREPAVGEKVTFSAHIVNKGNAPIETWEYQWLIDDQPVASGTWKQKLQPGEEALLAQEWQWKTGAHRIRCTVDPQHRLDQTSRQNDSLEVATDAWLLAWSIDRQTYESFNRQKNLIGTNSFEDWAQWHIARMNQLFQTAPSPLHSKDSKESKEPKDPKGGSRIRVACNKILVVPDAAQPWAVLQPGTGETPQEAGYDGYWAFGHPADLAKWASTPDWGLIHEWGHQLGLIDENLLDCLPAQNRVLDLSGDPLLMGHTSLLNGSLMHTPGEANFSPLDMAALESQYGKRRGYYGDHLFAVPASNVLVLQDSAGNPLPNARVLAWQQNVEGLFQGDPLFAGNTDGDGRCVLPNRPTPSVTTASGFLLHDNPLAQIGVSGTRNVLFFRIIARGQSDYVWLDVADLNMAYWSENRNLATYIRKTHIPPLNAPRQPENLRAEPVGDEVTFTWDPIPGVKSYRLYGTNRLGEWQPVGEPVTETSYRVSLAGEGVTRYALVSISAEGKESAFSSIMGTQRLQQPWAVAVLPNGRRLVRDRAFRQNLVQKPDGSFVESIGAIEAIGTIGAIGTVGTIGAIGTAGSSEAGKVDLTGSADMVRDGKGRIICVVGHKTGGTTQGFVVLNPDQTLALSVLTTPGIQPQHFMNPTGVAVDSHDNIFICDTENDRIQEYGPDGKFKAVIGVGLLKQPMKLVADKNNNLIICDTASDRLTVLRLEADGYHLHGHANNLPRPVYILTDPEGRYFISCQGDNSVVALNNLFLRILWNANGNSSGSFTGDGFRLKAPAGLALDGKGNLLVVDTGNRRIVTTKLP